jgi:hypothetical protein
VERRLAACAHEATLQNRRRWSRLPRRDDHHSARRVLQDELGRIAKDLARTGSAWCAEDDDFRLPAFDLVHQRTPRTSSAQETRHDAQSIALADHSRAVEPCIRSPLHANTTPVTAATAAVLPTAATT